MLFRKLLSETRAALNATREIIEKNTVYSDATRAYKDAFNNTWFHLASFLQIALQHPENAALKEALLKDKNGKEILAEHILKMLALNNLDAIRTYLETTFKLDQHAAVLLAHKIIALKNPQPFSSGLFIARALETLVKRVLLIFGAGQDVVSSFVSVTAIFGITNPIVQYVVLILGLANGINDASFGGENCDDAIDKFKAALGNKTFIYEDIIAFCLSFFFGSIIGFAQYKLILDMMTDPTATLPYPLNLLVTEEVAQVFSAGAGMRDTVIYSLYIYPLADSLVHKILGYLFCRKEIELAEIELDVLERKSANDEGKNADEKAGNLSHTLLGGESFDLIDLNAIDLSEFRDISLADSAAVAASSPTDESSTFVPKIFWKFWKKQSESAPTRTLLPTERAASDQAASMATYRPHVFVTRMPTS